VSDTFEFIDAEYADLQSKNDTVPTPSITNMCTWLLVSRSGYYEWRDRPDSATARRREELKQLVGRSFDASDGTYGYRRVHADLADWGVAWRARDGPGVDA
jgi:putative transposase